MSLATFRTERRIQLRIAEMVHARPSHRSERIWARSVADLRRLQARADGVELTPEAEAAADAHLARVAAEFGIDENQMRALHGDR
jgi:hypothetical protein